jgi:ATP-dependent DNA helicase RecQ
LWPLRQLRRPDQTWDATEPARQALSAVFRHRPALRRRPPGRRCWARTTKRCATSATRNSVYGVGKALAEAEWRSLFRQLVARGLADIDLEGYGGLRLSGLPPAAAWRGQPQLRRDLKPQTVAKSSGSSGGSPASQLVRAEERELCGRRCAPCGAGRRAQRAAYVIFPDSTLLEMLRSMPTSLSDMAQVSGVGARKLALRPGLPRSVARAGGTEGVAESGARPGATSWSAWPAPHDPAQIAGQLNCSEKNVYSLGRSHWPPGAELEQALDLPEELMMEVQDAFLDGEGELPPVSESRRCSARASPKACYCVRRWHRSSNCDRWHLCHLLTLSGDYRDYRMFQR